MINNFNHCLESINKKNFFIQDGNDKQPAFIVEKHGEFEVINNTKHPINFLKIDSCVANSTDNSRCDCAIYNNTTFCFIELKCIKPKNLQKNRRKAEKQLEVTIQAFRNKEVLKTKILEAYVCCNCKIGTDSSFEPITKKPNNKERIVYFMYELNTKLYCDTKKEFN
ncbi:hypothetical protein [Sulfurimonas sp.]|uniref:hypothetical protein n=1 Tax=Sulfurimonas sp. TaxID=2022749 RepID=UPI0026197314|nr:hypothetical protein [Sulfurimonas sp.]